MSDEIPFLTRLGDAFEAAAQRDAVARKPRRPRRLVVLTCVLLTFGGGAAMAGLLSDPEELASAPIECVGQRPDRVSGANSIWAPDRTPTEACADELGMPAGALVACDDNGVAVVFPGRGDRACRRAGLLPLPNGYTVAQARVAALERDLLELERTCLEPDAFAARVQELLDRSGWDGWETEIVGGDLNGPCGSVSSPSGDGERTIAGALHSDEQKVLIVPVIDRATENLLFGTDGLATTVMDASGRRCYTQPELRALASDRLADAERPVTFTVESPAPYVTVTGPRGARLAEGCAIIVQVTPNSDDGTLDVVIMQEA